MERSKKIDTLDLIINVLQQHEKNFDNLLYRLNKTLFQMELILNEMRLIEKNVKRLTKKCGVKLRRY